MSHLQINYRASLFNGAGGFLSVRCNLDGNEEATDGLVGDYSSQSELGIMIT